MTDRPEQEADWEDMTEEQAFRVGVLTELSGIRRALEALAGNQVDDPQAHGQDDEQEAVWTCSSCGESFRERMAARNHAYRDHNAPEDAWTHLYPDPDDEECDAA